MTHQDMSHTCHMRCICIPVNQIIKKICSCNNLLNATIQSHPIKMLTTINPIWHGRPVHPGTKNLTICSLKSKDNIILAHNFILKQITNQASHCFDLQLSIFSHSLGLDTLFFWQSILTLIVQTIVSAV